MLRQITNRVPVLAKSLISHQLDATEQLTQDHMKVESLFMQLKFLGQVASRLPSRRQELSKRREHLFHQLKVDLQKHMVAEETIFYPECEKIAALKLLINESFEEHGQVKTLLQAMNELSVQEESFDAKLTVLINNVMHHVREEEEKLFPQVQKTLSRTKLEKMAVQMRKKMKPRKAAIAA